MAQPKKAKSFRARIAAIAEGEHGQTPCSRKTGKKRGYFSSCHGLADPSVPELWSADFVRWVWWKAGAINTAPGTNTLTPAAISFLDYGRLHKKPRVGDAVLFDHQLGLPGMGHVAVVTEVRADGTIVSVGGDEGGRSGTDAHFAATARVIKDGPYNAKPGISDPQAPNSPLFGYVSPVEDDMPFSKNDIINMVKDGVAQELRTELGHSGITPAQGAKAAVKAKDTLEELRGKVDTLTGQVETLTASLATLIQQLQTPAPPAKGAGPAPNGGTRRRRAGSRTPSR